MRFGACACTRHYWTAFQGSTFTTTAAGRGARPAGTYVFDDEHSIGAVFRAQRNFNAGD